MRRAFRGMAKAFMEGDRRRRIVKPVLQIVAMWFLLIAFYIVAVEILT